MLACHRLFGVESFQGWVQSSPTVMKHISNNSLVLFASVLAFCASALAEEWPQYRGARGDGISTERTFASWPTNGPKRLWKANTPGGFSSFAIAEGKAFTVILRDIDGAPFEVCVAFDANTGKEIWATSTGIAKFPHGGDSGASSNQGGDGPRSTPAVSGHRVYVYSADMALLCLDAVSGKAMWKKDVAKEFSGRSIAWKSAMSPVIDGDLLYIAGGGAGESM